MVHMSSNIFGEGTDKSIYSVQAQKAGRLLGFFGLERQQIKFYKQQRQAELAAPNIV